uniref:Small ribosomal subunit protein uS3 n=1 Tax=Macrostomum lignano TaxID=282301 RepID=A0A1I8JDA4_9PLAT
MAASKNAVMSKKRAFVANGVFRAELDEFLKRELAEDGYSGIELRVTPAKIEVIVLATRTQSVLGEKGRKVRELTAVLQKRFGFEDGQIEIYAEKMANRGLSAVAQAESLRYKLLGGLAVRRACYGVLRFIMESGAKGAEVIVSGKLRGQRAKSMKFTEGFMIHSGEPSVRFIDRSVRHVQLRQGNWEAPAGGVAPRKPLPDHVTIADPKEQPVPAEPYSENKQQKPQAEVMAVA